jgi:AbrB family looped-hinge helix DNA binding protein
MIKVKLKVDDLGRVTIPKPVRKMLRIKERNEIYVMYDNTKLIIPKVNDLDISESIGDVIRVASDSGAITNKEFSELNKIMDKLKSELNEYQESEMR